MKADLHSWEFLGIPRNSQKAGNSFRKGLVPKNTFTDVFDISCDIGDFMAHIFCRQMTQELPKKAYDGGLNNCLQMHCHKSITDTPDTVKIG